MSSVFVVGGWTHAAVFELELVLKLASFEMRSKQCSLMVTMPEKN